MFNSSFTLAFRVGLWLLVFVLAFWLMGSSFVSYSISWWVCVWLVCCEGWYEHYWWGCSKSISSVRILFSVCLVALLSFSLKWGVHIISGSGYKLMKMMNSMLDHQNQNLRVMIQMVSSICSLFILLPNARCSCHFFFLLKKLCLFSIALSRR